jgi:2-dehydropantoate 2-reductase
MYRGRDGKATTQASSEETQLLNEFASMMDAGGQRITIEQDIQRVKFRKNFWNAAFSSFATLTNNPSMSIFRPPPPDDTVKYSPYLAPTTAHLVEKYTLPAIHAVLSEVLDLGPSLFAP